MFIAVWLRGSRHTSVKESRGRDFLVKATAQCALLQPWQALPTLLSPCTFSAESQDAALCERREDNFLEATVGARIQSAGNWTEALENLKEICIIHFLYNKGTRNNILWGPCREKRAMKSAKSDYPSLGMLLTHGDRNMSPGLFPDVNCRLLLCSTAFFFQANLLSFINSPYVQRNNYYYNYSKKCNK